MNANRTIVGTLPRCQIEITGRDRAKLLHGLCTNDIKRLQPGDGCEAFLTDVQGHVIGYVYVFCLDESLIVDAPAGQAESIIRNLDRYVVREDVRFRDCGVSAEIAVAGPDAATVLAHVLGGPVPESMLGHGVFESSCGRVGVRRTPYLGAACWQVSADAAQVAPLITAIQKAGALPVGDDELDVIRIECGTPIFGRDITDGNFPQEVDRNAQAISFIKGCYLGQETVARIDALGHVNRLLRGVRFTGSEVPPTGAEIRQDGKLVARVTSACFSTQANSPLALAYVKRGHHELGSRFPTSWGEAEVVKFG